MLDADAIAAELAGCVSDATVLRRHEPLARHTTLRVGGPADVLVEPATEADLAAILKCCARRDVPFFILGRGSNLIVRDRRFSRRGDLPVAAGIFPDRSRRGAAALRRRRAAEERGGRGAAEWPVRLGIFGRHSRQPGRGAAHERRRHGRRDL